MGQFASFEGYAGPLRRFFRRRVSDAEVEDCVQEVFLRMQARQAETAIQNPEAYLFSVARSVVAREGQRRLSYSLHVRQDDLDSTDDWLLADSAPDAEHCLIAREELARVLDALESLPSRTRHIFTMHRFEDKTYGVIAREFAISVSAVEKHIMAALRHLLMAKRR